jgi:uroporphyrinogen-III synthase
VQVLITRPQREAQSWVDGLCAAGFEAIGLPLITIAPVRDSVTLIQTWHHLHDYAGVMFVSGNAVEYFFASIPLHLLSFFSQEGLYPKAWATGPGTATALVRQGLVHSHIAAPPNEAGVFDSEALWQVVGAQVNPGDRILIVRGGDSAASASSGPGTGREWFANRVLQAGGLVDFVMVYQRSAPEFDQNQQTLAEKAATDGTVWVFSSTESILNLMRMMPEQSWLRARALVTHPRIALAAKNAGFGVVCESRPMFHEVMASIESMR